MEIEQALLEQLREELLVQVGQIVDESLGSAKKTRMDYVFDAMSWLSKKRAEFVSVICKSQIVKTLREHERVGVRLALAGAIADLICTCCDKVPVATVAVLLADEGINSLCPTGECDAPQSEESA